MPHDQNETAAAPGNERTGILTKPKEVITSVYREKRTSKHSEKPKPYGLIDSIVTPAARRAELFNRGGAPAPWIAFGNESGGDQ